MRFVLDDGGRQQAGFHGKRTGDCVCRAIAIATESDYGETWAALNEFRDSLRSTKQVRGSSAETGVGRRVYDQYLKHLGWEFVPTMGIGTGCRVHLRDGELPMGRLVVRCSRHLVAVIDGVIHDTYDPSRSGTRCVYGYYRRIEKCNEKLM